MRGRQPHGPYRLLGHSFGGSIAFLALTQKAVTADEHAQARILCRRLFGVPL